MAGNNNRGFFTNRELMIVITIFLIMVDLFFYQYLSYSADNLMKYYGGIISIVFFILFFIILYFIAAKLERILSKLYYVFLAVISIIIGLYITFHISISPIATYLYYAAVLIATLLALMDIRQYYISNRPVKEDMSKEKELYLQLQEIKKASEKYRLENESYRLKEENYKKEMESYRISYQKYLKESENYKISAEKYQKESENQRLSAERYKKQASENANNKKAYEKVIAELRKSLTSAEKKLKKKDSEITKESSLKAKYSKTLSNMRRKRKEEKELLVVSPDGKSVHKPKCISVRHISKDQRKLIKNWQAAQKEGYKGCKLCKPHIKAAGVIRNKVSYYFIASNLADKVHNANCSLARNISPKDAEYFKTYKSALKKGYTACRVCNPEQ